MTTRGLARKFEQMFNMLVRTESWPDADALAAAKEIRACKTGCIAQKVLVRAHEAYRGTVVTDPLALAEEFERKLKLDIPEEKAGEFNVAINAITDAYDDAVGNRKETGSGEKYGNPPIANRRALLKAIRQLAKV